MPDENLNGFYSLGADVNKAKGNDSPQDTTVGVVDFLPELSLGMKDDELLKLTKKWNKRWTDSTIRAEWIKLGDDNEKYWKGKQMNTLETSGSTTVRPLVDNEIFQSVETYLPAATRQNPEPLVEVRATEKATEEMQQFADIIRARLADWADDTRLRLKLKKSGRHWLIFLLGVAKMSWDTKNNRAAVKIIRPRKLVLDPDGVTDEDGYSGKFIGEHRKMQASSMLSVIKAQGGSDAAVKKIEELVSKSDTSPEEKAPSLGSDIQFIEWWTNEYMCWTIDDTVLLKVKNPHWNYEPEQATPATAVAPQGAETAQEPVNPTETEGEPKPLSNPAESPTVASQPINTSTPGMPAVPQLPQTATSATALAPQVPAHNPNNHFQAPEMPFIFISIFNLGATPVDVTSLITQNLPQQDLINKRLRQIDKNADGMNGGVVVSEEHSGLTKDEAKNVTEALRRGGTVIIPSGSPNDAIARLPNNPLPSDVFNQLIDTRNRMYDIFGIKGITPGGIKNEDTVRGKIITKGLDTDRIGGGITEYFEQFADKIYNWTFQLMYVYDDILSKTTAKMPKLKITVKEGSLLPKDATTKANQAIELCNSGKMSVIDMYKALEYPNPEEMAANLWLEANAPEVLFKDNPQVMQVIQAKQQAQAAAQGSGSGKPPSESINFKDLPPEGKAQMAKQAGIELHPVTIAAHDASKDLPPVPDQGRSLLNQVPTQ